MYFFSFTKKQNQCLAYIYTRVQVYPTNASKSPPTATICSCIPVFTGFEKNLKSSVLWQWHVSQSVNPLFISLEVRNSYSVQAISNTSKYMFPYIPILLTFTAVTINSLALSHCCLFLNICTGGIWKANIYFFGNLRPLLLFFSDTLSNIFFGCRLSISEKEIRWKWSLYT